jgi:8-oxo-dGTP pyrophosphatase MutT (NUDIX family)
MFGQWRFYDDRVTLIFILPERDVMSPMTRVVAAVIEKKRKYLACQRPGNKRHGGLWEFPGGKVRANETDTEAVRRELAEELNVHVIEVGATLYKAPDPGSDYLIVFKSVRIIGEPQPLEHDALCWAAPLELMGFRLAPSDEMFVHRYLLRN